MSSASSTDRGDRSGRDSAFQPWQFYLLLSMGGATWAVIVSRHTQPAALLLLSAAVIAAGLVATALHYAVLGFMGIHPQEAGPVARRNREFFEREKALVLRSIKELEFDHAMKKVGEKDFAEMSSRLRARAVEIMEALEEGKWAEGKGQKPGHEGKGEVEGQREQDELAAVLCASCGTKNDHDAQFCKKCGAKL